MICFDNNMDAQNHLVYVIPATDARGSCVEKRTRRTRTLKSRAKISNLRLALAHMGGRKQSTEKATAESRGDSGALVTMCLSHKHA